MKVVSRAAVSDGGASYDIMHRPGWEDHKRDYVRAIPSARLRPSLACGAEARRRDKVR